MCAFSIDRRAELIANFWETIENRWEKDFGLLGAMQRQREGLAVAGLPLRANRAIIAQFVGPAATLCLHVGRKFNRLLMPGLCRVRKVAFDVVLPR
jgi:hypothetical protein